MLLDRCRRRLFKTEFDLISFWLPGYQQTLFNPIPVVCFMYFLSPMRWHLAAETLRFTTVILNDIRVMQEFAGLQSNSLEYRANEHKNSKAMCGRKSV